MRRIVIGVGLLASLLLGVGVGGLVVSQELPPEMRMDQYLLEGQRALEHEDPAAAVQAFQKLDALPVDPPVEFAFWYGHALVEHGISQNDVGMVNKGEGFLTQYLLETGRESEHYANALTWLSQAEGHGLPRPQRPANEVGPPTAQAAAPEEPEQEPEVKETKIDQCDNNLWGRWECLGGRGDLILSHTFDSNGIEQVTLKKGQLIGWDEKSYSVDKKWHPNTQTGKEDWVSCNGWNKYGFRVLDILTRDSPSASSGKYVDYYVNHKDVLWITEGEIHKDGNGKVTSKEGYSEYCRRW